MSTCLNVIDATAPSRAPIRMINAMTAWFRRSISVSWGIDRRTCRICSSEGTRGSRTAFATRASYMVMLKYSVSALSATCNRVD